MFGLDTFGLTLFCLGALGTFVYAVKMFMMLALGIGDDEIMDVDVGGVDFTVDVDPGDGAPDIDIDDSDASFTWLSINIVTSFMMLFGWFGLGTYQLLLEPQLFPYQNSWFAPIIIQIISVLVGGLAGYGGIKLNTWMIKQIIKFHHSGTMDKSMMVGQLGTVYIRVSPDRTGAIMIKADNGILMEMSATTHRKEVILAGKEVKVIGVKNDKLVIEPVS